MTPGTEVGAASKAQPHMSASWVFAAAFAGVLFDVEQHMCHSFALTSARPMATGGITQELSKGRLLAGRRSRVDS